MGASGASEDWVRQGSCCVGRWPAVAPARLDRPRTYKRVQEQGGRVGVTGSVDPRSALHGAEVPENVQSCEGVGVVALDNLVRNITMMAPALGPKEVAYLGECAERAFPPAVG